MNRLLLPAILALACAAASAGLGSGGHPADAYSRDEVAFGRRGALGADAYVVTNVFPQSPCYALATNVGTSLVDRAVNCCSVTGDVSFVAPPAPQRRSLDAHRTARAFILVVDTPTNRVPEVSFVGFGRIYAPDGGGIEIARGRTLLSFVEIGAGEFLVETRELSEIR